MSGRKPNQAIVDLIISRDAEVMGGTPVFAGTRVPVKNLFDHIIAGRSINEFPEHYPRVSVEDAAELLVRLSELVEQGSVQV